MSKKKIGLIVNPIAGMGGSVGLKGTDGRGVLREAIAKGARPVAPLRARAALDGLTRFSRKFELICAPGKMGADTAKGLDEIETRTLGMTSEKTTTTAADTKKAARLMLAEKVDLLLFCGGDGTCADIMSVVDKKIPILGIPAGVKMYSATFATKPEDICDVVGKFLDGKTSLEEAEVMDIDEEKFRRGSLKTSLAGYALVPRYRFFVQPSKLSIEDEGEEANQKAIANYFLEKIEPDTVYVLGAGTTVKAIADSIGVAKTLLGVDIVMDGEIIAKDVSEKELLEVLARHKHAKIVVSPIGAQGFVFGRGNQQISANVIKKVGVKNVIAVATQRKLASTPFLRIDTGDPKLDASFGKYLRVLFDYRAEKLVGLQI